MADFSLSSVQVSHSLMSESLQPHALQQARLPCPSPTPRACSNSCLSSQWYHSTILSSVVPFSSCLQSFPASETVPRSQLFTSRDQSIRASASETVVPVNIQEWFPLGLTGLTSLQSKGLSRGFSNNTAWKHQFFGSSAFFMVHLSQSYMTAGKTIGLTLHNFDGKWCPCFLICCLGLS